MLLLKPSESHSLWLWMNESSHWGFQRGRSTPLVKAVVQSHRREGETCSALAMPSSLLLSLFVLSDKSSHELDNLLL
jgi:hypothetical protein